MGEVQLLLHCYNDHEKDDFQNYHHPHHPYASLYPCLCLDCGNPDPDLCLDPCRGPYLDLGHDLYPDHDHGAFKSKDRTTLIVLNMNGVKNWEIRQLQQR